MQANNNRDKAFLRKYYRSAREKMPRDIKREKDLEIQSRFLVTDEYRKCSGILLYVARDFEIDTHGIICAAFANNKTVAVPKLNDDYSMSFYRITSFSDLEDGKFSISEPKSNLEKITDFSGFVCVTPSLCCDLSGNRLGFGKGCYDRFFIDFNGTKVALSYSNSIEVSLPNDENDIKVDVIVTDSFTKNIEENTILSKEDNYE